MGLDGFIVLGIFHYKKFQRSNSSMYIARFSRDALYPLDNLLHGTTLFGVSRKVQKHRPIDFDNVNTMIVMKTITLTALIVILTTK